MTTPNIEELMRQLRQYGGDGGSVYHRHLLDAATALQSQAERIKDLERESETHAKAYGLAIVERDNLRHELKVAQEGWRCECSTDDACRFARERDAKAERIKELESECEVERLRLAACGVAALGYFDGCKDEYKSASLDDVLRLNKRCADLRAELGDLPEAQAEMLAEIKRLRAQLAEIGRLSRLLGLPLQIAMAQYLWSYSDGTRRRVNTLYSLTPEQAIGKVR